MCKREETEPLTCGHTVLVLLLSSIIIPTAHLNKSPDEKTSPSFIILNWPLMDLEYIISVPIDCTGSCTFPVWINAALEKKPLSPRVCWHKQESPSPRNWAFPPFSSLRHESRKLCKGERETSPLSHGRGSDPGTGRLTWADSRWASLKAVTGFLILLDVKLLQTGGAETRTHVGI